MSYDFDLGSWSRKISTDSDAAQLWFDRGLNWTYGFNHEEAVDCFRRAADADPSRARWPGGGLPMPADPTTTGPGSDSPKPKSTGPCRFAMTR